MNFMFYMHVLFYFSGLLLIFIFLLALLLFEMFFIVACFLEASNKVSFVLLNKILLSYIQF